MKKYSIILSVLFLLPLTLIAQTWDINEELLAEEKKYYDLETLDIPEDIYLEVGGMDILPDGRLIACSRRGEVYIIDNIYEGTPTYKRFAHGLHEPLGVAWNNGNIYVTQRSELTRLIDNNGDDKADVYETVYQWPLDGNYHEYSYGPLVLPNNEMLVTLNLGWEGKGVSKSKWRGWMLKITEDGNMEPIATGLRSPAGFGVNGNGDIFYAENQGDWVGSGRVSHIEKGDFLGNPMGLAWTGEEGSPLDLQKSEINDSLGTMYEAAKKVEELKPPAFWFPHAIMGISTTEILLDDQEGKFGPFNGQLFISDQGQSKIMRVFHEKVNGVYQGVCFPFREGYASGLIRLVWGKDGVMFGGMTNRGWRSIGGSPYSIQRLKWNGKMPFEIQEMRIKDDGFELKFTEPVDSRTAGNPASYTMNSFTYKYHHIYGSPAINIEKDLNISKIEVSDDRMTARLYIDGLRLGYVHEIRAEGVRSAEGKKLVHNFGYYTLNQFPSGGEGAESGTVVATADENTSSKRMTEIPEGWGGTVDKSLFVGTKPGLRFDAEVLEVKAGSKIKLALQNPDDMQHNLVIVKPGQGDAVAQAALEMGIDGPGKGHIPESDDVIFHTGLVEPDGFDVIYFKAPTKPGDYVFICTVPGHATTMRGVFRVVK